jgi:hypothetical protein
MSSKVFLFEDDHWLYCSDVTLEDGVYHGWVENGAWHLMYDTRQEGWFACHSRDAADSLEAVTKGRKKLTWACDPGKGFDYNEVIEDARVRYESGEPADYELKPEPEYEDEYEDDDGVPF